MIRLALLLSLGCLFFLFFPQIDIATSSLFYHHGFYLKKSLFARFIYEATIVTTALFAIATLSLLLLQLVTKKRLVDTMVLIYLLATLAIGPGLVVNELFKNHFGRARPSQITTFGGTKAFTPALVPTDQCKKNCSFSSGHAAAAFYFVALFPLVRRKRVALLLALLWGWTVGFVRIIQGGHFLSDVYCSMVVDILVAGVLYWLLIENPRKGSE